MRNTVQATATIREALGSQFDKDIDKSGDRTYRPGQRLVIREGAVVRLAELVEKLGAGLQGLVP